MGNIDNAIKNRTDTSSQHLRVFRSRYAPFFSWYYRIVAGALVVRDDKGVGDRAGNVRSM